MITFIKYLVTYNHCVFIYLLILRLCRILKWGCEGNKTVLEGAPTRFS